MNLESTIESLRSNGYSASAVRVDDVDRAQIIGARHDFYYQTGDYASGKTTPLRDPVVNLAVLEFHAADESPLVTNFIGELLKIVAPTDRMFKKHSRPLVRTTATSVQAVYRAESHASVALVEKHWSGALHPLYEYGLIFADEPNTCARAAKFHAICGNVLVDVGEWLNDRSPLTVKRDDLPLWNQDEITPKLRALVDDFVESGKLRIGAGYLAPPPNPQFTHSAPDISIDPSDWDPQDPRRYLPGVVDEVRQLRREALGREPRRGEIIR